MENAYSVLETFYLSFAMTKHMIACRLAESRRDYAEEQVASEEALLNSGTLDPTEQSRSLGALAALKTWIAEDDRLSAEIDAMYADYCDAHPELLAVC